MTGIFVSATIGLSRNLDFRRGSTVVLGAVCIVLVLTAVPLHAAAFDDDVKIVTAGSKADQSAAWKRLLNGGNDAIAALVKGLDVQGREAKQRLVGIIDDIRQQNKSLRIPDTVVIELARRARLEQDFSTRAGMALELANLGGPVALKELERFAGEDPNEEIRRDATLYASEITENETRFFKKQTNDKSRLVRLVAFAQLAKSGDASGRDLALQTIKNPANDGELEDAVWLLGEIGNMADSAVLQRVVKSSADDKAAWLARQALKTIELLQHPPSQRLSFLIQSLDDPSETVRHWAGNKLYFSSDPQKIPLLKKYLSEPGHKGYGEADNGLGPR